jgi:hypothetical protein
MEDARGVGIFRPLVQPASVGLARPNLPREVEVHTPNPTTSACLLWHGPGIRALRAAAFSDAVSS